MIKNFQHILFYNESNMTQRFKICLIGSFGVGKSTLIKQVLTKTFDPKYDATLGVDVNILVFNTNYGLIVFDIWDCAGQDEFSGLGSGYFANAKGVIAMFDVTSPYSMSQCMHKIDEFDKATLLPLPLIVCANKIDKITSTDIFQSVPFKGIIKVKMSVKTQDNYLSPFLYLAQELTNHKDLLFI